MSRHSYRGDFAEGLGGGVVLIAIVLLVLALYLTIKAINLVVRVLGKYPDNKALWIALGCVGCFGLLAAITQGEPVALTLCGLSVVALLIIARIVEVYYDNTFQRERGPLVAEVLRRSWWEGAAAKAA